MKYMGSKARIAKHITPIILESRKEWQCIVVPFCGGLNDIAYMVKNKLIESEYIIAMDNNKYLIAMWKELQNGWIPPEFITREFYSECRDKYNNNSANINEHHVIGYVGFNGSYGGRFYDGGYAGKTMTKQDKERNYPLEAYNNVMKQVEYIKDINFDCGSYQNMEYPKNSIIYCDIPYKGTKQYKTAAQFNYDNFYEWCIGMKELGHEVFISEYWMPDDKFECIWDKEVSSSLRANSVISGDKKSVERLFKVK